VIPSIAAAEPFDEATLETTARAAAEALGVGFGKLAQPLRAALTGRSVSPGIFEVMVALGRDEVLGRLEDAASGRNPAVQHGD
jgi:glutamyl-tRNA synthetase